MKLVPAAENLRLAGLLARRHFAHESCNYGLIACDGIIQGSHFDQGA